MDDAGSLLSNYFRLVPADAIALLRAARSYQKGLWIAEDDPEFAWLKFVSAIEVVANVWMTEDADPTELLTLWNGDLAELLRTAGSDNLLSAVAKTLVPVTRATGKFLTFLDHFDPGPPAERPDRFKRVDWNKLRKSLQQVYAYRSAALHAGKPFPGPLLEPPLGVGVLEERPHGVASAMGSSVWVSDALPMLLFVFERITRLSILKWAEELAGRSSQNDS